MNVRDKLLKENPWKLMLNLSIPAILGQFIVGLYAFVDSIYVGQMVGTDAMSAVSAASPFILINNAVAVLLGIGSGSVLSRAIGDKDEKTIKKIMGNFTFLVILLSSFVMILGIILSPWLISLSGAKGNIQNMGVSYLRIIYIGSIFVNFMQGANMIIRAEGRMKTAMGIMGAGALLNIILDPIFILLFPRDINKEIFSVGISAMLMQIMMLIQMTIVYNTAVRYGGKSQIALMGAAQRVLQLAFVPIWGMSQGMQPAIGTNFGAKEYLRVKKLTNVFIIGSTVLAGIFFIIIEIFSKQILSTFITNYKIVNEGVVNFRLMYLMFLTYGFLIMIVTYFQAIGKSKQAGFLVMLRQFLLVIPLVLIIPILLNKNVLGVWLALPINDTIIFIFAIFMLMKEYKYLNNLINRTKLII